MRCRFDEESSFFRFIKVIEVIYPSRRHLWENTSAVVDRANLYYTKAICGVSEISADIAKYTLHSRAELASVGVIIVEDPSLSDEANDNRCVCHF